MTEQQMEADFTGHVSWTKQDSKPAATDSKLLNVNAPSAPQDLESDPQNPCMQALWEKISCDKLKVPYKYQNVAALIIHWANYLDKELNCEQEV